MDWLNAYNTKIRKTVGRELDRQGKTKAIAYMNERTKTIKKGDNRQRRNLWNSASNGGGAIFPLVAVAIAVQLLV